MFARFGAKKTPTAKTARQDAKTGQKSQDGAFELMEKRIAQIHYYFRNADLSPEVRQVMTYRKLMELDYFTPQAAKELLRQWNHGDKSIP
ncbi:MAG: hypothetical protein HC921_03640 [Synechococcaceae cyanobacterium SM2_3_1]|nr:hypothetical protein [Synechococcaceae cyanobacterium SM2_3_1]